jgi:hypothetical protein
MTDADPDTLAGDDRTPNIHGFDDSDAADAGFEIAEPLAFQGGDDPDDLLEEGDAPTGGELVPVQLAGQRWTITNLKKGKIYTGLKRPQHTSMSSTAARTPDASQRGLALALMRRGPYDVRPGLLALVRFAMPGELEEIMRYGAGYVQSWAALAGRTYAGDVLQAAAADALAIVLAGRESRAPRKNPRHTHPLGRLKRPVRVSLAVRAKALHIDVAVYRELRKVALSAFTRRLREATARYRVADNYRPVANGRRGDGNGLARGIRMQPNVTTAELSGAAAHIYHARKPTMPPFDWHQYNAQGINSADCYNSK